MIFYQLFRTAIKNHLLCHPIPLGSFLLPVARLNMTGYQNPLSICGKSNYTQAVRGDGMKVRIEVVDGLTEDEVLIRCGRVDESVRKIYQFILEQSKSGPKIIFYRQNQEYYFSLADILFFETEGEHVYAHTAKDTYLIKYRLYELEQILPHYFVRIAKSTIVNVRQIYSIARNLTSSSLIQFTGSHKQVYASRYYYGELQRRLKERGTYET